MGIRTEVIPAVKLDTKDTFDGKANVEADSTNANTPMDSNDNIHHSLKNNTSHLIQSSEINSNELISHKLPQSPSKQNNTVDDISTLLKVDDFKQRQAIIQKLGWEPFRTWFLDFEFRNWWQLNGCTGVPLHKIYRTSDGQEKKWKDWATHAPSKTKARFDPYANRDPFPQQTNRYSPLSMGQEADESYGMSDAGFAEMEDTEELPFSNDTLPMEDPAPRYNGGANIIDARKEDDRFDKMVNSAVTKEVPKKVEEVKTKPTKFSEYHDIITGSSNTAIKVSDPEVKVNWSQNDRLVSIRIHMAAVPNNAVKIELSETLTAVKAEVDAPKKYSLEIELSNSIMKDFQIFTCQSEYVDLKVKKDKSKMTETDGMWATLCKQESTPEPDSTMET